MSRSLIFIGSGTEVDYVFANFLLLLCYIFLAQWVKASRVVGYYFYLFITSCLKSNEHGIMRGMDYITVLRNSSLIFIEGVHSHDLYISL